MELIVHYFHHAGRSKIALWGINPSSPADHKRLSGYLKATRDLGLPLSSKDVIFNDNGNIQDCTEHLLARLDRYDGIITSNDLYAVYVLDALKRHGCRVPEDVFLAAFGNTQLSRLCQPAITTATLNHYELGRQATKGALYLLNNPDVSHMTIEITGCCHVRDSTENVPFSGFLPFQPPASETTHISSYDDPRLKQLAELEMCLNSQDDMSRNILRRITSDKQIGELADALFLSESTLGYRLGKF